MHDSEWLIYGATGFTGRLVAEEAVRRGHRPVLGGRSTDKLRSLAEALALEHIVCDLQIQEHLAEVVAGYDLVCHLAGPYIFTGEPMLQACLASSTSYLDVCGEIPVLQAMQSYDQKAREKGVAIIPAAGFVVTPADCGARYAAEHVLNPVRLETAIATTGGASAGTVKTLLETLPGGILIRENGRLVQQPIGRGARRVTFLDHDRPVIPVSQADLVTAHLTTGIPEIISYLAVPEGTRSLLRTIGPITRKLVSRRTVRRFLSAQADRFVRGPDADERRFARSYTWVRVMNGVGDEAQVWFETKESYQFTAHAVVRAAERILTDDPQGLLTPAQAFGADFVLDIPGTTRREVVR